MSDMSHVRDMMRSAIGEGLSELHFFESACPSYQFRVTDATSSEVDEWGWDVKLGVVADTATLRPTCLVELEMQAAFEILTGSANVMSLLDSGRLRVGGLVDDVVALGSIFVPPEQRVLATAPPPSTTRRKRLAAAAEDAMTRTIGHIPPRMREMLSLWVEHRIDRCRLDHWTKICVPDLEVSPWEDSARLGIDELFDRAFDGLRAEAQLILDGKVRPPHYGVQPSAPDEPIRNRPQGWRNWTFIEDFEWRPAHCELFPVAKKLLEEVHERVTVCHASFLVMEPGVFLPTHSDAAGWAVSYNYGIIVPPDCHLTVAREQRQNREGQALAFNDSFIHKAANDSDKTRIVFQVICANPGLTADERRCLESISKTLPAGALVYAIEQS
jgi:hypothetical protein